VKFAIEMQHIASADECIKLLSQLRAERRTGFKSYNEAMRVYQQELSDWYAIPKDERGARPAEPVYDGPTDLDMRMDVAMVTHLQWSAGADAVSSLSAAVRIDRFFQFLS
jgi:hypothetical protein